MIPVAPFRSPETGARADDARRVATGVERSARALRKDATANDTEEPRNDSAKPKPTADFSTLLALLAGTGPRVRQAVMTSLSHADRSLLDKLMDATGSSSADGTPATDTSSVDAGRLEGDTAMNALSQAASDAMRYGAIARDERPVDSRAALLSQLSGSDSNDATSTELQRALSRAAGRRTSVEQLLARGDGAGASVRGALESILDRAGTDAAAALAMLAGSTMPAGAAIASTGAATANTGDVNDVNRDASALVPEFRSRVERVIARMKSEYGHDVSLAETARSQERQDFLFEQGRTRPGQIVTWTHDSAHTRGEAADVVIDGSYNNAEGFARLQRIAREEGLRTLGVKDPGHLELPRDARSAESMLNGAARVANSIEHPAPASSPGVSGIAQVAGVAGIAGVARVAERSPRTMEPASSTTLQGGAAIESAARAAGASTRSGGDAGSGAEGSGNGRDAHEHRRASLTDANAHTNSSAASSAYANSATITGTPNTIKAGEPASTAANAAQRATDAQDLRESAPGSLSRLTMQVDGANGDDRITIDLRGKTVGTHISTDASTADGLRARTGELQDALGRHGLDADTVRISNTARAEASDASRAVGSERDALKLAGAAHGAAGDGAGSNGARDRAPARDFDKEGDARRARDEQKEQDARRRGGQRNFNEGQR